MKKINSKNSNMSAEKLMIVTLFSKYDQLHESINKAIGGDYNSEVAEELYSKRKEILSILLGCDFQNDVYDYVLNNGMYDSGVWFEHKYFSASGRKSERDHVGDGMMGILLLNIEPKEKIKRIMDIYEKFKKITKQHSKSA